MPFFSSLPALTKSRLERLRDAQDEVMRAAAAATPRPRTVPPKFSAERLHNSVDRMSLREAHLSKVSSRWLDSGTGLLCGASYIQAVKIHMGVVTTPARSAWGWDADSNGKLGCGLPRTAHNILQVCPRVQPWRLSQHNGVIDLLADKLQSEGLKVTEAHIPTSHGTRVPDIICWRRGVSFVIDVQVCGDSNVIALNDAHLLKVTKYNILEVLA